MKAMDGIRIGLIGVGGFGATHLAQLEPLEKEGVLRLVAVSDFRSPKLSATADALQQRGIRWHEHYASMLAEEDLEAVIISTPIPLHKEMTLAALRAGLHVYLEKPPVPLLQDLRELIAADDRGRVAVGFTGVTCPILEEAKSAVLQGRIGRLKQLRLAGLWPRRDSYYQRSSWAGKLQLEGTPVLDGPATNAMSHYLHALAFLAGDTFAEYGRPSRVTGELYRARPIESYDLACLGGKFENGVEFTAALGHPSSQYHDVTFRLIGTEGMVELVFGSHDVSTSLEAKTFPSDALLLRTLLDFTASIRAHRKARSSLSDCVPYVQMTNAMVLSSGRIHDIPRACVSHAGEDQNAVYHVEGIHGAVRRVLESGELFSRQDLPWAMPVTPEAAPAGGLTPPDLERLAAHPMVS